MKKILALNLAILLMIGLCGCTFSQGETALGTETAQDFETVDFSQTVTTEDPASDESETALLKPESTSSATTEPSLDTSASQPTVTTTKASESTTSAKRETTTRKAETTKKLPATKPSAATESKTTVSATTQTATKEKSTTSPRKETTTQKAETTKQEQTESNSIKCTIRISCETVLNNEDKLKENKKAFVPKSGRILNATEVTLPEGSSAFDVLKKACEENVCTDHCPFCQKSGIQFDFSYTPAFGSNYIRGIHQIYEKDCGTKSGWEYFVNGVYQNVGCNKCFVKNGDIIEFVYTCDLGDDI